MCDINGIYRNMGANDKLKTENKSEYCIESELVIGNTQFWHKEVHRITRELAHRRGKAITDLF